MAGRSMVAQKRSISLPLLGGLVVIILCFLTLAYSANWFSINGPIGLVYQNFVGILFFFVLFAAPVILTVKTKWPVWFIGLGCGFVTTTLVQIGIQGTPADAEAIGSLLCIGFVAQSGIATGMALATSFVLKKLHREGANISSPNRKTIS